MSAKLFCHRLLRPQSIINRIGCTQHFNFGCTQLTLPLNVCLQGPTTQFEQPAVGISHNNLGPAKPSKPPHFLWATPGSLGHTGSLSTPTSVNTPVSINTAALPSTALPVYSVFFRFRKHTRLGSLRPCSPFWAPFLKQPLTAAARNLTLGLAPNWYRRAPDQTAQWSPRTTVNTPPTTNTLSPAGTHRFLVPFVKPSAPPPRCATHPFCRQTSCLVPSTTPPPTTHMQGRAVTTTLQPRSASNAPLPCGKRRSPPLRLQAGGCHPLHRPTCPTHALISEARDRPDGHATFSVLPWPQRSLLSPRAPAQSGTV